MVKKKEKTKGWKHEYRFGLDEDIKADTKNRKEKEKEGLSLLLKDISPHMDGYSFEIEKSRGLGGADYALRVSLQGGGTAEISFRYPYHGSVDYGSCAGIKVSAPGNPSLGRNYGFDFDSMRVPAPTLQKIIVAIKEHLEGIVNRRIYVENRRKQTKANAEEVTAVLQAAGYEVKSAMLDETRIRLNINLPVVLPLYVLSSGAVLSVGSMESVPIHATSANIVEVVKAIEQLRAVMDH